MQLYTVNVVEKYTSKGQEQERWYQIGTGFEHKDGEGLSLRLAPGVAVSAGAELVLRKIKAKDAAED